MIAKRILAALLTAGMVSTGTPSPWASDPPPPPPPPAPSAGQPQSGHQGQTTEAAPARISYLNGEVSFWRPGAAEWTTAKVNTPLAPGDLLYTGPNGNVEVQIGSRAFVRAAEGTQLGLDNQEPDFVQLKVTAGHASLDLRELAPGHTVELDTPNAAFTVEHTGYYRVDVGEERTAFVARRAGRATVTAAAAAPVAISPNQQVMVMGTDSPRVETTAAPELTAWDRWNDQRTDQLLGSSSAPYVPPGVYGTPELDRYGSWRVVETNGPVWVPSTVVAGWVPYSTGRWIWDPRYGWTWLDDAPWGWAPYHYGRWVFVSGFWAWAPGPIVVRPVYAPALVVFLGGPGAVGRPLCWAPLGWGEPVIPWWGRPGFVGRPWWGGWGGPRVVNNVVVHRTTVVTVQTITVYTNVNVVNAVVGVPADRFGHGQVRPMRLSPTDVQQLTPVRGPLAVKPVAASVAPATGAATRPPETIQARRVVATRPPRDLTPALRAEGLAATPTPAGAPIAEPRLVPAPKTATPSARATVGPSGAPGGTPPPRVPAPARPEVTRDNGVERPHAPASPGVATPQQRRDAPRADAPTPPEPPRGDTRPPTAPDRQAPPPSTRPVPQVTAPAPPPAPRNAAPPGRGERQERGERPERDTSPAGDTEKHSRQAPPAHPVPRVSPPAPPPAPGTQAPPARIEHQERGERPDRPAPGRPEMRGRRSEPQQPTGGPVASGPEPGQPRARGRE